MLLLTTGCIAFGQNASTYVNTDTTTRGQWMGTYGGDGYQIANGSSVNTSYGTASVTASTYTWTSNAGGSPALQNPSGGAVSYITSAYLAASTFTINVNLTDGNYHTVALYLLDWDGGGQRAETITVQDGSTGTVLANVPVKSFTGFNQGVWVTYTVKGNVNFLIASTNQYLNAVVSGIFLSPAANTPPTLQSQTITFNPIATQTVGTPLALTASSGLSVIYAASPASVCIVSGTTATFLAAGNCSITASQGGDGSNWAPAANVSQSFAINGSGTGGSGSNAASYASTDTATGGNWVGTYGGDGYQIANGSSVNASYGSTSVTHRLTHGHQMPAALQRCKIHPAERSVISRPRIWRPAPSRLM